MSGKERFEGVSNEDLVIRWQDEKDGDACAEVLRRFDRYLSMRARKRSGFANYDNFEDLLQAARIGFMRGMEKWDRRLGHLIATIAAIYVSDALSDVCSNRNGLGGISRSVAITYGSKVRKGLEPEEALVETAKALKKTVGVVRQQIERNSLHKSMSDENFREPGFDPTAGIIERIDQAEKLRLVRGLMEELPERETELIRRHVMEGEALRSIARDHNVSPERARQICKEGLDKVRERFAKMERCGREAAESA